MHLKLMQIVLVVFLTGCTVSGNYAYEKQGDRESHKNELVLTYKGKINDYDYKIRNKVNFDKLVPDKPSYYESSYEIYFW